MAYAKETTGRKVMHRKDELLEELRVMFRNVLAASEAGGSHARLSRARGNVDGYMRALMDLGVATREELLGLIAAERARANGPAVGTVDGAEGEGVVAA
jgi:hypothetical protein